MEAGFIDVTKAVVSDAVDKYSGVLLRIAFFHTRNKADAEDIVQDAFLSMLKKPSFESEEHLKKWLIKVAINKAKDLLKSAARRKSVPLDEAAIAYYGFDGTNTAIMEAVAGLKPIDKNIIFLYYFEGYSAKETADIIGKRENTVHARLSRAREKLKIILQERRYG